MSDFFNNFNSISNQNNQNNNNLEPKEQIDYFAQAQEEAKQALEQRARNKNRYQIVLADDEYEYLNEATAKLEDPAMARLRIGTAKKISQMYQIPFDEAYTKQDEIQRALWGDIPNDPTIGYKRISDALQIGMNNVTLGKLGVELMQAELTGDTEKIERLNKEIKLYDDENNFLNQSAPKSWISEMGLTGWESLPYTTASALPATLLGILCPAAGIAAGTLIGGGIAGGQEYIEMRKAGYSPKIAAGVSAVSGGVQGLIEQFLGEAGKIAGAATGRTLNKIFSDSVKKSVIQDIQRQFYFKVAGRLATKLTANAGKELGEEVAEEVLQGLVSIGGKAIANHLEGNKLEDLKDADGNTIDLKYIWNDVVQNAKGGLYGAIALGGIPGAINTYGTVKQYNNLKAKAKEIHSPEMFANYAMNAKDKSGNKVYENVTEGMSESKAKTFYKDLWREQQNGDIETENAKAQSEVNRSAEGFTKEDEESEEYFNETKEARNEDGDLITQDDRNTEGTSGIYKVGDSSKGEDNLYGFINYKIDEENNTVEIEDFVMNIPQERLRQEFYNKFAEDFAGFNITWETKGDVAKSIKDSIIANNPNGEKAGLTYYSTKESVLDKESLETRKQAIKDIMKVGKELGNDIVVNKTHAAFIVGLTDAYARNNGMTFTDYYYDRLNAKFADVKKNAPAYAVENVNREEAKVNAQGKHAKVQGFQIKKSEVLNGESTIYVTENGDRTTVLHEVAHGFREHLNPELLAEAEKVFGVQEHDWKRSMYTFADGHTESCEEAFARAMEDIVSTGKLSDQFREEVKKNGKFKEIMQKFIDFLARYFKAAKQYLNMTPDIENFFNELLKTDGSEFAKALNAVEELDKEEFAEKQKAKKSAEEKAAKEKEERKEVYNEKEEKPKTTETVKNTVKTEEELDAEKKATAREERKQDIQQSIVDTINDTVELSDDDIFYEKQEVEEKISDKKLKDIISNVKHTEQRQNYINEHYTNRKEDFEIKSYSSSDGKLKGSIEVYKGRDIKQKEINNALVFVNKGVEVTLLPEGEIEGQRSIDALFNHHALVEFKEVTSKNPKTIADEIKEAANKGNTEVITVFFNDESNPVSLNDINSKIEFKKRMGDFKAEYDELLFIKGNTITRLNKNSVSPAEADTYRNSDNTTESKNVNNINFQILGEKGAKALDTWENVSTRIGNLALAKDMDKAGKDAKTIRLATSWEKGIDGKWRYEINDDYHLKNTRATNGNIEKYEKEVKQAKKELEDLIANKALVEKKINDFVKRGLLPKESSYEAELEETKRKLQLAEFLLENNTALDVEKALPRLIERGIDPTDFWGLNGDLGESFYLPQIIDNPELYKAYPELEKVTIAFSRKDFANHSGSYSQDENSITIYPQGVRTYTDFKRTLIHEVQHAIQRIENFVTGGSIRQFEPLMSKRELQEYKDILLGSGNIKSSKAQKILEQINTDINSSSKLMEFMKEIQAGNKTLDDWFKWLESEQSKHPDYATYRQYYEQAMADFDEAEKLGKYETEKGEFITPEEAYRRLAGEVEARNVSNRMNLTAQERLNTLLTDTQDVASDEQIVIKNTVLTHACIEKISDILTDEKATLQEKANAVTSVNELKRNAQEMQRLQNVNFQIISEDTIEAMKENSDFAKVASEKLEKAKNYEKTDQTPIKIKSLTNWERDNNGKWIYETDDSSYKLQFPIVNFLKSNLDKKARLADILESDELYSVFPMLKEAKVKFSDGMGAVIATFNKDGITINKNVKSSGKGEYGLKGVLAHEIQHFIQVFEELGAKATEEDIYEKLNDTLSNAGEIGFTERYALSRPEFAKYLLRDNEIEARAVAKRIDYDEGKRQFDLFRDTYNIAKDLGINLQTKVEDDIQQKVEKASQNMQLAVNSSYDEYANEEVKEKAETILDTKIRNTANSNRSPNGEWSIYKELKLHKGTRIVGEKIDVDSSARPTNAGWDQLREILDIFRNKSFETFRYVLINPNGKIEKQFAVTAKTPGVTPIAIGDTKEEQNNYINNIAREAFATNCKIVFVHNHPSGNITQSPQDISVTKFLRQVPDLYLGHMILDHNSYNLNINSDENESIWTEHKINGSTKDKLLKEPKKHKNILNRLVIKPSDIDVISQELNDVDKGTVPVFFTNYSSKITSIAYYSEDMFTTENLESLRKSLEKTALNAGTLRVFAITDNENVFNFIRNNNKVLRFCDVSSYSKEQLYFKHLEDGEYYDFFDISKLKAQETVNEDIINFKNKTLLWQKPGSSVIQSKMERAPIFQQMPPSASFGISDNQSLQQGDEFDNINFQKITDEDLIKKLDSEPTIKVYRAMQEIDGKLYPPMAAVVDGKFVQDAKPGEWFIADENPELAIPDIDKKTGKQKVDKKTGELKWKFNLSKGGKDASGKKLIDIPAAYNPYWHTSRSPLNDQFSSAYKRPNLVTVEVEIPESELTSGYKAERAKDAVGEVEWKSGVVSSKLAAKGNPRKVILSRYCKINRVIPNSEVASQITSMLKDTDIAIPDNTVTPSLLEELKKQGVKIEETEEVKEFNDLLYSKFVNFQKSYNENDETDVTHSQNFKNWFGDWENDPQNASKVVDEDGKPLVVYHGTYNGEFDIENPNINFQTKEQVYKDALDSETWQDFMNYYETFGADGYEFNPSPKQFEDMAEQGISKESWYKNIWELAHKGTDAEEVNKDYVESKDGNENFLNALKNEPAMLDDFLDKVNYINNIDFNSDEYIPTDAEEAREFDELKENQAYIRNHLKHGTWLSNAKRIGNGGELTERTRKTMLSLIAHNPEDYREIYTRLTGDDTYALSEDEKQERQKIFSLVNPDESIEDKSPEERKKIAEDIKDKVIADKVKNGTIRMDGEIERYISKLDSEIESLNKELNNLDTQTKEDYARIVDWEHKQLLRKHDELLKLKEEWQYTSDSIARKIDKGLRVTDAMNRKARTQKKNYDEMFRSFTELENSIELTAGIKEALDRQEKYAEFKQKIKDKESEKKAVAQVRKLRKQLVKRTMRNVDFARVDYENAKTICAIQEIFEPNLLGGVNKWIGTEGMYLRGIASQFITDADEAEKIKKALANKGTRAAINTLRNLNSLKSIADFDKWTKQDRADAYRSLPREDWIKELHLDELSDKRKSTIKLDIGTQTEIKTVYDDVNGKTVTMEFSRPTFSDEIGERVKGALGEDLFNQVVGKPFAEWTTEELEELAIKVNDLYKEGRDILSNKQNARKEEAEKIRRLIESAVRNTGIQINDDDTPEEKEQKLKKIAKILGNDGTFKGFEGSTDNESFFSKINTLLHGYNDATVRRVARILDNYSESTNVNELYRKADNCYKVKTENKFRRQEQIDKVMKENNITYNELFRELEFEGQKYTVDDLLFILAASEDYELDEEGNNDNYAPTARNAIAFGNLMSSDVDNETKASLSAYLEKEPNSENAFKALQGYIDNANTRFDNLVEFANDYFSKEQNQKLLLLKKVIQDDYENEFERIEKVSIEEFNQPVNRVRKYIPIIRKESNGDTNINKVKQDLLGANGTETGFKAGTDKGFTKNRVRFNPLHQKPIESGLYKTWLEQVDRTEHFIAYSGYVRELNRVYKSREAQYTRRFIENRYGKGMLKYLDDYINEIANPNTSNVKTALDEYCNILRGKAAPAYLAWKASSIIKQGLTSPAPFMQFVNPATYLTTCFDMMIHKDLYDVVREKSVFMKDRTFDPMIDAIKELMEKEQNKPGYALDKFNEVGMKGLEWIDWVCVAPGWLSCYRQKYNELVVKNEDMYNATKARLEATGKYTSENIDAIAAKAVNDEIENMAVQYADDCTRLCQPSSRKEDLAPLFKNSPAIARAVLQFQTSLNVIWNNIRYDLPYAVKNQEYKQAVGMVLGYVIAGILMNTVCEGLPTDDDEDKTKLDNLRALLYYSTTQFSESMPVIGQAVSNLSKQVITGEKQFSNGNDIFPMFTKIGQGTQFAIQGNWQKSAKNFAEGLGLATGLPVSGTKELLYMFGIGDGEEDAKLHPLAPIGRRNKDFASVDIEK